MDKRADVEIYQNRCHENRNHIAKKYTACAGISSYAELNFSGGVQCRRHNTGKTRARTDIPEDGPRFPTA